MKRTTQKALRLRKETLRQLDPAELSHVAGGVKRQVDPNFDWEAYFRACMGTNYTA